MNERAVRDRLVEHGRKLFDDEKEKLIEFTGDSAADALLNDLGTYPHAFVLACLMDRQMKYGRAWLIPYRISQRMKEHGFGEFSIGNLCKLSPEQVKKLMSERGALHRFPDKMGGVFHSALQRIAKVYEGDASRIWADEHPVPTLFTAFFNLTAQVRKSQQWPSTFWHVSSR
jgi:hypothetical protein